MQLPYWLEAQGMALIPFQNDLDSLTPGAAVEVWIGQTSPVGVLMSRPGRRLGVIKRIRPAPPVQDDPADIWAGVEVP